MKMQQRPQQNFQVKSQGTSTRVLPTQLLQCLLYFLYSLKGKHYYYYHYNVKLAKENMIKN